MIRVRLSCALETLALFGLLTACPAREPEPLFEKPARSAEPAPPPEPAPSPQPAAPAAAAAPAAPPPPALTRSPTSPDPLQGKFSLGQASAGLPGAGKKLKATIETGIGKIECQLYGDKTPRTVANFVGLARGLRPFWDAKQSAWVKRPLYDGTSFHRTIVDFMIQGGDVLGDGTGEVGYVIDDELVGLKHDRAGLLCMANRGANTNGGQFFITDAPTPHLTSMGTYTIFGECTPTELVHKIALASNGLERPASPIAINKVTIAR